MRMQGHLESAVLERCLNEIVRRHEILSTVFPATGGQPSQKLNETGEGFHLRIVDLRNVNQAGDREAAMTQEMRSEVEKNFDLANGPLLRALLLQMAEEDHVLLITMHHIVTDGWSIEILRKELGLLYGAFVQGQPSPLPDLPFQYADYAVWQRK